MKQLRLAYGPQHANITVDPHVSNGLGNDVVRDVLSSVGITRRHATVMARLKWDTTPNGIDTEIDLMLYIPGLSPATMHALARAFQQACSAGQDPYVDNPRVINPHGWGVHAITNPTPTSPLPVPRAASDKDLGVAITLTAAVVTIADNVGDLAVWLWGLLSELIQM